MTSQTGFSRKFSFDQHETHRLAPWVAGTRHDRHLGGTMRSTKVEAYLFATLRQFRNWNLVLASATSSSMTESAPQIFDRALYLARQARAIATHDLQNIVAAELEDRLSIILKQFLKSLLIAQNPHVAAETLKRSGKVEKLDVMAPSTGDVVTLQGADYDAIFSLLDLHCVNDVPGHLAQLARGLKPDGLLLVAFFAGDTLFELRESWLQSEIAITGGVSPRVAPMIGVRELGGLMQRAGLALPVADMDRTIVRYADAFALMGEICRSRLPQAPPTRHARQGSRGPVLPRQGPARECRIAWCRLQCEDVYWCETEE